MGVTFFLEEGGDGSLIILIEAVDGLGVEELNKWEDSSCRDGHSAVWNNFYKLD